MRAAFVLTAASLLTACAGGPTGAADPERVIGGHGALGAAAAPTTAGILSGRCLAPSSLVLAKASGLLDDGLGLVSQVIANNGGTVIANNGGMYDLLAAGQRPLVGFKVRILDGAGQPVRDAAGNPYEATTDRAGRYAFPTSPRGKQHLLELALPGDLGRLVALLPDAEAGHPRQTELEGVGTHILGYMLDTFVKADQGRLDKLDANGEALAVDAAEAALAAKAAGVLTTSSLAPAAVVTTVGVWRGLSPELATRLDALGAQVQAP